MSKENPKIKIVEKLAKELLSLMGTKAEIEATWDEENQAVLVKIASESETGLLIGKHGETILAVQTVLGMMVKSEIGEWVRIMVDVGDWRQKQESRLKELALQAAQRVEETGQPQNLYNLTASQRRVIHLCLADNSSVVTESLGEGKERYLVIRAK